MVSEMYGHHHFPMAFVYGTGYIVAVLSCWIAITTKLNAIDALSILPPISSLVSINVPVNSFYNNPLSTSSTNQVSDAINAWLLASSDTALSSPTTVVIAAVAPPSEEDVTLLRSAFAEMYRPLKNGPRNYEKAYQLLSSAILRWEGQPNDERAGLYRVRGDCNMIRNSVTTGSSASDLANAAYSDYNMAVSLLQTPEARTLADPQEYPAALLGRARATKSLSNMSNNNNKKEEQQRYAKSAAEDYRAALIALGRVNNMDDDEIYDDGDRLEEGMKRNPYAAWEWGDSIWKSGNDYLMAANLQTQTSTYFDEIGDRARSVISQIDAGIALAAASGEDQVSRAEDILRTAIQRTVGVQSRDVQLLQHVITKEGEGRMALAALLWSDGKRMEAEQILGEACVRLDQLQAQIDIDASRSKGVSNVDEPRLLYSIDDNTMYLRGKVLSCSDFKKPQFLSEKLEWPESLQRKVTKLETLQ
jgi:hypothetical protein